MSHIILHELQHVIFALRKPPVNLRDVRLSDLSCILLSHQNVLKRGSGIQMSMGRQKQVRASGINAYPISGYMRQPSPSHQMCAPKNIKQLNHQQYGNTHRLWSFNLRKRFFCIRDSTLQI